MPASTEPAAAFGLLLGNGDGALQVILREQALGRSARLRVAIGVSEAPAQERLHELGSERVGHDPRLVPTR